MSKQIVAGLPNIAVYSIAIVLVLGLVGLGIYSGLFSSITQSAIAGSCSSLGTISSNFQYTQASGISSQILALLNSNANTYGVFKGTIQFTGPCMTVNAQQLKDPTNTYNGTVNSFSATLTHQSADYNFAYYEDGATKSLTQSNIVLAPTDSQSSLQCTADQNGFLTLQDPIGVAAGKYIGGWSPSNFNNLIPVSCTQDFIYKCKQQSGYLPYFSTSQQKSIGPLGTVLVEPAECLNVTDTSSAMFLSSTGNPTPDTQISIYYNNQVLTLDTLNGPTRQVTSDGSTYFDYSNNFVSNRQPPPTNLLEYYDPAIFGNPYLFYNSNSNYAQQINSAYSSLSSAVGGSDLQSLINQVNNWNSVISYSNVTGNQLGTSGLGGNPSISNNGQIVTIDTTSNPYLLPSIDFITVANKVSVTANVASGFSFVSTSPSAGQCTQTSSTTINSVSATLASPTPGSVSVSVACNSPLGLLTSSQQITFVGGDVHTVTFPYTAPANNYSCTFTATNGALGSQGQTISSNSFCVQSSQTQYQNCPTGSLEQVNINTGQCQCMLSSTQGTNVCAATGQLFNPSSCMCYAPSSTSCTQPSNLLSCQSWNQATCQVSIQNGFAVQNGQCVPAVGYGGNGTSPLSCSYPLVPVATVSQSPLSGLPFIGGFFTPSTTYSCELDPNLVLGGVAIVGIIAVVVIIWLASMIFKPKSRSVHKVKRK